MSSTRPGAYLVVPLFFAAVQLATALCAQTVLPAGVPLASSEGNDKQVKLFGCESGQFRFQQVDADLRTAQRYSGLAFRRDGFDLYETAFPRAAEIEIVMGEGRHNGFTDRFADNYRYPTRNMVYTRKFVSLPDLRDPPVVRPSPFLPAIPFDHPFDFTAQSDLVWEICVLTTLPTRTAYPLDAHQAVPEQFIEHRYGIGCVANPTLPVIPMSLSSTGITYSGPRRIDLAFYVDRAPEFEFPVLLWGTDDCNVVVPGLCTNLYVQPMLAMVMPQTNAAGTSTLTLSVPYIDELARQQVANQVVANDPHQPYPLKVAASNGTSVEIMPPMPRVKSISAPLAQSPVAPTGIDHGFGIVVRLN